MSWLEANLATALLRLPIMMRSMYLPLASIYMCVFVYAEERLVRDARASIDHQGKTNVVDEIGSDTAIDKVTGR